MKLELETGAETAKSGKKMASAAPAVPLGAARNARAQRARAAAWLRGVWGDDPLSPAFRWEHLEAVPEWAHGSPAQLEQLALTTGALFAAPALRVCLSPATLLAVRTLIGAESGPCAAHVGSAAARARMASRGRR
jgi:hypothetical protein